MERSEPAADPTIRPFEAGDLPRLHEIREAAFRPVFASFRRIVGEELHPLALRHAEREQAALLDDLCRGGPDTFVLVAVLGAEAIGFVACTANDETKVGEIGLNAVHPDRAGRGVGARLYDAALDRLKKRGMAVAEVSTGGDPSHAPARRAYEKVGFGAALPSVTLYRRL